MFAKTIIDSDAFLDMPLSTQALYFHLSMRADDEGFVNNPKKIQRSVGASYDDIRLLISKNFIIPFDTGVVVIKHWRIHNYIRADRMQKTPYQEERAALSVKGNGAYTFGDESDDGQLTVNCPSTDGQMSVNCPSSGCQVVGNCPSDVSIGKDSIDKDSIDIYCRAGEPDDDLPFEDDLPLEDDLPVEEPKPKYPYKEIIAYLNEKTGKSFRDDSKDTRKHIAARIKEGYTKEDFFKVIDIKVAEWAGTEMDDYLRPSTLFSTKFEGYLNQRPKQKEQKKEQGKFVNYDQRGFDYDAMIAERMKGGAIYDPRKGV